MIGLARYQLDDLRIMAAAPKYGAHQRNLGAEIMASAIADYRSLDPISHASAKEFLYPASWRAQRHFEWAVSLAPTISAEWLRESLNRMQPTWDAERAAKVQKVHRRELMRRARVQ
jgi:hypothetical protein